jgi:hypothetical protein
MTSRVCRSIKSSFVLLLVPSVTRASPLMLGWLTSSYFVRGRLVISPATLRSLARSCEASLEAR